MDVTNSKQGTLEVLAQVVKTIKTMGPLQRRQLHDILQGRKDRRPCAYQELLDDDDSARIAAMGPEQRAKLAVILEKEIDKDMMAALHARIALGGEPWQLEPADEKEKGPFGNNSSSGSN